MNKKVYDLMNWPEIEGIVYSECDAPSALLGGHVCESGYLIQVFRPDAVEIKVTVKGRKKIYQMEKVDEAGYFAIIIPGKKALQYTLTVENLQGRKDTYTDPYSCHYENNEKQIAAFLAGNSYDAYKFMGAHTTKVGAVSGTVFTVWAPNAVRVSVVGEFNHWDGRLCQMDRLKESGLFQLFIPGVGENAEYSYEIKKRGGQVLLKSDPYANRYTKEHQYRSVVCKNHPFTWEDSDWESHKEQNANQNPGQIYQDPMSIYEMMLPHIGSLDDAKMLVQKVKTLGFTHVEFLPVCEYVWDDSKGYETLGYYALTDRIGTDHAFAMLVNEMHMQGIGVIVDWNAAFFGQAQQGLEWFDGTQLYESGNTHFDGHTWIRVSTFDYKKPPVRSFLLSSVMYWVKKFHLDGIRIDEVASMLYLNYGKNPGEWTANVYGGPENLEAADFLRQLSKLLERQAKGTLLYAEENSNWPKVTGHEEEESLGFHFKWNTGWKQDMVEFMLLDPLYRKSRYDTLTHSMLYHYSESYICECSHKAVNEKHDQLSEIFPENELMRKDTNLKNLLGYLFMYPGKKLINEDFCNAFVPYIRGLNHFYQNNPALYEMDYEPGGFEWINNSDKEQTVLTFARISKDNQYLLVVTNFTPVLRSEYRIGVPLRGKYTEVFNSDAIEYGGTGALNVDVIRSVEGTYQGREQSIQMMLPPLSIVVLRYDSYTEIELKEIAIRQEASKAKQKADERTKEAFEFKEKAEREAKAALIAEENAKEAARLAQEAKMRAEKKALEAEKKAQEAEMIRQRIEEETAVQLLELHNKADMAKN